MNPPRVQEAIQLLAALGMPKQQQNERTAYVLLGLLELGPTKSWIQATGDRRWRTVELMQWMRDEYGKNYAANSREMIRRLSLHQLNAAGLVLYNPDDPGRAINSPDSCYQIAPETLELVRQFGTATWEASLASYLKLRPTLVSTYARVRELKKVPVIVSGQQLMLSPGKHSQLIREVVEQFAARYVPGGTLLYVGDTGDKHSYFNQEALAALGVVLDPHGKKPDVVLHDVRRGWLVLVEAAASHGPVDNKRHAELARLFAGSRAGLVYVSAFSSRAAMREYLGVLAWETEAWTADAPDHLIHFNGDRYLGPHG